MGGDPSTEIILIFILMLLSIFFTVNEISIKYINKMKIITTEDNKNIEKISKLFNNFKDFLITIQFSNIIIKLFLLIIIINLILKEVILNLNTILIIILISYIIFMLKKILLKVILKNSKNIILFSTNIILLLSKIIKPFIWFLPMYTEILSKTFNTEIENFNNTVSKKEIQNIIDLGEEQGTIDENERDMIDGVIQFNKTLAKEIMTPRIKTFCLEAKTNLKENINLILQENYSRIPIYEDEIDNIVGIVYMKDILASIVEKGLENITIYSIMKKPYMVPEVKNINELLKELKSSKNHMAILIDEYGGFSGIVTMEDLIEEVVGEISDEYDENYSQFKKIDNKNYIVDGLVTISQFNKYFDLDLDLESELTDTIGGLVLENLDFISKDKINQKVIINSITFKILALNNKRIEKVQITFNE